MKRGDSPTIPEGLESTYRMLICAFPDGISSEDYWPVLALLEVNMGFRTLASIIAIFTEREYGQVYNDALSVASPYTPKPAPLDLTRVKQHLRRCGYDAWLKET